MSGLTNETYLGDGLYASFDGFMITLRAPREIGNHWIGLEPEVYQNLLNFADRITAKKANAVEFDPDENDESVARERGRT